MVAQLRRTGREAAGLDGVSPALRAWASDFGKTRSFQKMHQRSSPPPIRPLRGFPRVRCKVGWTAVADTSLPSADWGKNVMAAIIRNQPWSKALWFHGVITNRVVFISKCQ